MRPIVKKTISCIIAFLMLVPADTIAFAGPFVALNDLDYSGWQKVRYGNNMYLPRLAVKDNKNSNIFLMIAQDVIGEKNWGDALNELNNFNPGLDGNYEKAQKHNLTSAEGRSIGNISEDQGSGLLVFFKFNDDGSPTAGESTSASGYWLPESKDDNNAYYGYFWTTEEGGKKIGYVCPSKTKGKNNEDFVQPVLQLNRSDTDNIMFLSSYNEGGAKSSTVGQIVNSDTVTNEYYKITYKSGESAPTLGGGSLTLNAEGTSTWVSDGQRVSGLVNNDGAAAEGYIIGKTGGNQLVLSNGTGNYNYNNATIYWHKETTGTNFDTMSANATALSGLNYSNGKLTAMTLGSGYTAATNAVTMSNGFTLTLENAIYNQAFTVAAGNSKKNTINTNGAIFFGGNITINDDTEINGNVTTVAGNVSINDNTVVNGEMTTAAGNFNLNIGGNNAINNVNVTGKLNVSSSNNYLNSMDVKIDSAPVSDKLSANLLQFAAGTEFNISNQLKLSVANDMTDEKNILALFDAPTVQGLNMTGYQKALKADTGKTYSYKVTPGSTLGTIQVKRMTPTIRQIIQGCGESDIWGESGTLSKDFNLSGDGTASGFWYEDEIDDDVNPYTGLVTSLGTYANNSGARSSFTLDGAGHKIISNGTAEQGGIIIGEGNSVTFKDLTMQGFGTAINNSGITNLGDGKTVIFVAADAATEDIYNDGTVNITGTVTFDKGISGTGTTNINVDTDMGTALLQQDTVTVGTSANLTVNAGQLQAATVEDNGNITLGAGDLAATTIISGTGKIATGGNVNASITSLRSTGDLTNTNPNTLKLSGTGSLASNIKSNGTTEIDANANISTDKTIDNKVIIDDTATITNTGTISGNVTNEGKFITTASGITGGVTNNASMALTDGDLGSEITGTGMTTVTGNVTNNNNKNITQNNLTINNGGRLTTDADSLAIGAGGTGNIVNNADGGLVFVNDGTLQESVSGTGSIKIGNGSGKTGNLSARNTINQAVTISTENDSLTIDAGNLKGKVDNKGKVVLNGGTLEDGYTITGGKLTTGGEVRANVLDLQTDGGITNNYDLILTAAGDLADNITGTGRTIIDGTIANNKTISQNVLINRDRTLTNTGQLSGNLAENNGLLKNSGTISAPVINNSNGVVINNATGKITGNVKNDGNFVNKGSVTGNINNTNIFSNEQGGNVWTITNSGTLYANGGSFNSDLTSTGTVVFNAPTTINGATLSGKLKFNVSKAQANSTIVTNRGTTVDLSAFDKDKDIILIQETEGRVIKSNEYIKLMTNIDNFSGTKRNAGRIYAQNGNQEITRYRYNVYQETGDLIMSGYYSLDANPRAKTLSEAREAAALSVFGANDLISDAMDTVDGLTDNSWDPEEWYGKNTKVLWKPFFTVQGSHANYKNTGDLQLNGSAVVAGLVKKIDDNKKVALFINGGNGNYNTETAFADGDVPATVNSKGETNYFGAGVYGKYEGNRTNKGNFYADASVSAGHSTQNFRSCNFKDETDADMRYDTGSNYINAYATVGYSFNAGKDNKLETYAKYLYGQMGGSKVFIAFEDVDFDRVVSSRLRAGVRYSKDLKRNSKGGQFKAYGGLAYEYEFDGTQSATAGYTGETTRGKVPDTDFKGGSGMAELGLRYKPSKDSPWKMDLTVLGFAGTRESIGARFTATYEIGSDKARKEKRKKQEEQTKAESEAKEQKEAKIKKRDELLEAVKSSQTASEH